MFGRARGLAEDWGDLPRALSLIVDPSGVLRGRWSDAIDVYGLHTHRVESYTDANGHTHHRTVYYTELGAAMDPPLLMGLTMRPHSLVGKLLGSIFGQSDVFVGDAALDDAYHIRAGDEDLTKRVLPGRVAGELLAPNRPRCVVTDAAVTVELSGWVRDVEAVRPALEQVGRVGHALLEVRQRERAWWEPAFVREWSPVAQAWGLRVEARRAQMEGEVRGASVVARTSYEHGLRTSVHITHPDDLGCELSLARQGSDGFLAKLFRGQDISIGDAAFDAAFVVKGVPSARVRAVLSESAREKLLEIHERASLFHVKQNLVEVWARGPVLDAANLDEMLKLVFAGAEALRPRAPAGDGPYRG